MLTSNTHTRESSGRVHHMPGWTPHALAFYQLENQINSAVSEVAIIAEYAIVQQESDEKKRDEIRDTIYGAILAFTLNRAMWHNKTGREAMSSWRQIGGVLASAFNTFSQGVQAGRVERRVYMDYYDSPHGRVDCPVVYRLFRAVGWFPHMFEHKKNQKQLIPAEYLGTQQAFETRLQQAARKYKSAK